MTTRQQPRSPGPASSSRYAKGLFTSRLEQGMAARHEQFALFPMRQFHCTANQGIQELGSVHGKASLDMGPTPRRFYRLPCLNQCPECRMRRRTMPRVRPAGPIGLSGATVGSDCLPSDRTPRVRPIRKKRRTALDLAYIEGGCCAAEGRIPPEGYGNMSSPPLISCALESLEAHRANEDTVLPKCRFPQFAAASPQGAAAGCTHHLVHHRFVTFD